MEDLDRVMALVRCDSPGSAGILPVPGPAKRPLHRYDANDTLDRIIQVRPESA
jgi:hypothetical protein